jgi:hypothetical protein
VIVLLQPRHQLVDRGDVAFVGDFGDQVRIAFAFGYGLEFVGR